MGSEIVRDGHMEIHKDELKRQIKALGLVALALYILFGGANRWAEVGQRAWAEWSPMGFCVTYYRGREFQTPIFHRSERHAVRNYASGRLGLWRGRGEWTARWDGVLDITNRAESMFYLQSIGGARLWIDNELVIDKEDDIRWNPGQKGQAELEQGLHRIRLEHMHRSGPAALRLKWTGGGIPVNTILGAPHVRKPDDA